MWFLVSIDPASGGTLSFLLGKHALLEAFSANIYVNDLTLFDPTWFPNGKADCETLCAKLDAQMECKQDVGIVQTSLAYMQYLKLGMRMQVYAYIYVSSSIALATHK